MGTLQHLRFGHDIVFTFGPLGYLLHGVPAPELALQMMLATMTLVLIAMFGIWSACAGRPNPLMRVAFLLAVFLSASALGLDYLVFFGVLGLLARASRSPRAAPFVAVVISAVGLFGLLSKQTLGLDVFASAGIFWLSQFAIGPRRRRWAAGVCLAIAAGISGLGLLAAFGGSFGDTLEYLNGAREIISGYSSAMAVPGPRAVSAGAVLILAVSAFACVLVARERKAPLALAIGAALFLAWKHGFVRADGHVINFFVAAAVMVPMLGMAARGRNAVIASAAATWVAYAGLGWSAATFGLAPQDLAQPARLFTGLAYVVHPLQTARTLRAASAAALEGDQLLPDARHRIGTAGVDVIPSETAIVYANGLRWRPLPVFQSYSAYTPKLDELDRARLAASGANITLMKYEDIDARYPLSVEPATFSELACRYRASAWTASTRGGVDFIPLVRQGTRNCSESDAGRAAEPIDLAAAIAIPAVSPGSTDLIRASIMLHPTTFGTIAGALWRMPATWIEATYQDGSRRRWRLVADTARDGVIVSPMPRDVTEARAMFGARAVPQATVTSIQILTWSAFYRLDGVRFTRLRRDALRAKG